MKGAPTSRASVESLAGAWRKRAKALRRSNGDTPAVALDRCADDREAGQSPVRSDLMASHVASAPPNIGTPTDVIQRADRPLHVRGCNGVR